MSLERNGRMYFDTSLNCQLDNINQGYLGCMRREMYEEGE